MLDLPEPKKQDVEQTSNPSCMQTTKFCIAQYFDTETPTLGPRSGDFFPSVSWANRINISNFLMSIMNTKYSDFI